MKNDRFQCSSASRKFLNAMSTCAQTLRLSVSVLFSEPKIPQLFRYVTVVRVALVSVLFSEPKIPQSNTPTVTPTAARFQCSSASRKFLNVMSTCVPTRHLSVSVLFSEPKIPQLYHLPICPIRIRCFSALQRAENSSI